MIMDATCEDYEDLEMICKVVERDTARCGMPVGRADILGALAAVVRNGLVMAYRFVGEPLGEVQGLPPIEEMEIPHTIYFHLTPKGMEVQVTPVDDWPFDGQGNFREGWSPPTD
jgi:hypothetical protein